MASFVSAALLYNEIYGLELEVHTCRINAFLKRARKFVLCSNLITCVAQLVSFVIECKIFHTGCVFFSRRDQSSPTRDHLEGENLLSR